MKNQRDFVVSDARLHPIPARLIDHAKIKATKAARKTRGRLRTVFGAECFIPRFQFDIGIICLACQIVENALITLFSGRSLETKIGKRTRGRASCL